MKIRDVQIDGFGVWSGLHVDSLPEGMTVFYGPNEAGKTTLMQFVRTMFYGFTQERRQRYLPPIYPGKPGGAIRVTGPGGGYEIARRANMNESGVAGNLTVAGADGLVQGQHRLASLLGQVDESIFTNVFAIGLRELQELSTLDDTAAADELYKLSSGLDRVSLVDVIRQLRTARGSLVSTGEKGQVQSLLLRKEKLRDEIEQLSVRGRRWGELASIRRTQQGEIEEQRDRISQWELEAKTVEVAMQVRTPWSQRADLQVKLKELNARTDLPDNASDRLKKILADLEERKQKLLAIRDQRQGLRERARALPVRRSVVELTPKIEAASEQSVWIASLQKQIQRIKNQIEQTKEQLIEDCQRLGMTDADVEALLEDRRLANMPDLSREAIARLSGPAREVANQSARLRQIRNQNKQDENDRKRLEQELNTGLQNREQQDLHEAMAHQSELITRLRKRLMMQERLEKLIRSRQELEDEAVGLGTEEALPSERAFMLALPFVGGGFLILSGVCKWFGAGFFTQDHSQGTLWILSGILLLFFWYMWRSQTDRGTENDLDDCEEQLEAVRRQIRKMELERDDFDKSLPTSPGSMEQRLRDAEAELAALEALLPTHHNYQAAVQRHTASRKAAAQAVHALKSARSEWQQTLKSLGLADSLAPKSIRIMAEGYESLLQTRRRLKAQEDELQQREVELGQIAQRIDALAKQISVAGRREGSSSTGGTKPSVEANKPSSTDPNDPRNSKGQRDRDNTSRDQGNKDRRDRRDAPPAQPTISLRAASDTASPEEANQLNALSQIQTLTSLVAEQQHYIAQRKELKEQDDQLAKQQAQLQKAVDRLVRARQALLAELGVESPEQLEDLLDVKRQHEKIARQIEETQERIRAIIGGTAPYETIARQLDGPAADDLERRWETLQSRIQQAEQRVAHLLQRQGEINQEMKSLAAEKRLAEAKLELACLEKQIAACAQHWQTLGATTCMLEKVCEVYENERQPETLREASTFLKQLTEGKYVRVWTPLGKNALRIDNQQGQSLPLEVLSRGTREAVFIALRLSLAAAYSRRGVQLPLVLDDVLVNFDANRATSAARVLRDFADLGHQVLMFTCHEHIMRVFYDIGVQVRVLPPQGAPGEARIYEPVALPQAFLPEPPVEVAEPAPVEEPVVAEVVVPEPVVEKVIEKVVVPAPRAIKKTKSRPQLIIERKLPVVDKLWYEGEPAETAWFEAEEPPVESPKDPLWWNDQKLETIDYT